MSKPVKEAEINAAIEKLFDITKPSTTLNQLTKHVKNALEAAYAVRDGE